MNTFSLSGRSHIELCDLLKIMGYCTSGGVAKNLIAEGHVAVDGVIEYRKRCKIHNGQVITLYDNSVTVVE